jgi:hypothetical protein
MSKKELLKQFAPWSPSKATLAATCPLAFKYRYIDHAPTAKKNIAGVIGVIVHRAQELVLQETPVNPAVDTALLENKEELTDDDVRAIRKFREGLVAFKERLDKFKVKHPVDKMILEEKWAVRDDFTPCDFDDASAMMRGVLDLALLLKSGHVIIIDHKTGRRRPAAYYKAQLDTYSVFALSHMPHLIGVQCALHYVAHQQIEWSTPTNRPFVQNLLRPWLISYLARRAERAATQAANPGKHCKWCDFREICAHAYRGQKDVEAGTGVCREVEGRTA